ncbi:hypothetical protein B5807_11731 [Epicoccum nigrum]|uniref:Uncharacterized protein n=1 Tax=Epicoccum nigrum TaxID=105696 RepID=A0A1Y2LHQ3_EPING|nr:hypothetical protein B5807_11731 [Epicoccum nigrum]
MQRSGCLKMTIATDSQQPSYQEYMSQISSWFRSISRNLSSALSFLRRTSTENLLLPQHSRSTAISASEVGKPREPVSQREKYLMTCMHDTRYHVKVNQELLREIATDRQLFDFLKAQTRRFRGIPGNILSMRHVQRIFFVKFRLHKGGVAQIRHHKYCCTQQICECIPPQSKVIKPPMGSGEYDCSPSGPPDTWPPVCPEFMMHMYHSPQCIAEDDTSILEQLPKKMHCKLDETTGVPPDGWGLYFQEDIDISTIIAVIFISLFVASLLFFILWTILKDDIQGASGVSAYIVAVASMAGIWIATKSKSFG